MSWIPKPGVWTPKDPYAGVAASAADFADPGAPRRSGPPHVINDRHYQPPHQPQAQRPTTQHAHSYHSPSNTPAPIARRPHNAQPTNERHVSRSGTASPHRAHPSRPTSAQSVQHMPKDDDLERAIRESQQAFDSDRARAEQERKWLEEAEKESLAIRQAEETEERRVLEQARAQSEREAKEAADERRALEQSARESAQWEEHRRAEQIRRRQSSRPSKSHSLARSNGTDDDDAELKAAIEASLAEERARKAALEEAMTGSASRIARTDHTSHSAQSAPLFPQRAPIPVREASRQQDSRRDPFGSAQTDMSSFEPPPAYEGNGPLSIQTQNFVTPASPLSAVMSSPRSTRTARRLPPIPGSSTPVSFSPSKDIPSADPVARASPPSTASPLVTDQSAESSPELRDVEVRSSTHTSPTQAPSRLPPPIPISEAAERPEDDTDDVDDNGDDDGESRPTTPRAEEAQQEYSDQTQEVVSESGSDPFDDRHLASGDESGTASAVPPLSAIEEIEEPDYASHVGSSNAGASQDTTLADNESHHKDLASERDTASIRSAKGSIKSTRESVRSRRSSIRSTRESAHGVAVGPQDRNAAQDYMDGTAEATLPTDERLRVIYRRPNGDEVPTSIVNDQIFLSRSDPADSVLVLEARSYAALLRGLYWHAERQILAVESSGNGHAPFQVKLGIECNRYLKRIACRIQADPTARASPTQQLAFTPNCSPDHQLLDFALLGFTYDLPLSLDALAETLEQLREEAIDTRSKAFRVNVPKPLLSFLAAIEDIGIEAGEPAEPEPSSRRRRVLNKVKTKLGRQRRVTLSEGEAHMSAYEGFVRPFDISSFDR
ncbi:uncharacterized protein L969DRAFT_361412 [Mixia osmundae IAM 14324]|uniref:Uncharacterized protein n=1 Tax=Mixia osmundae (strain CBS 9802 / IAM 14324 / JCM 22182 / KY 12970) TaxID=764103 RepID=G7EAR5_MIXOS|nr:uncharacterized protein L969DRAFT_361412 [Mixia osmundae IAM 14324]KEI40894.1 hypothetical protein L969DRAFT_361412 [Mixia osmundae IAM 14324]GAA99925.1 hypothetical protein E5Q_06628 [Mixia osmundae IAM 14324]